MLIKQSLLQWFWISSWSFCPVLELHWRTFGTLGLWSQLCHHTLVSICLVLTTCSRRISLSKILTLLTLDTLQQSFPASLILYVINMWHTFQSSHSRFWLNHIINLYLKDSIGVHLNMAFQHSNSRDHSHYILSSLNVCCGLCPFGRLKDSQPYFSSLLATRGRNHQ